jgi:hypothetical protein
MKFQLGRRVLLSAVVVASLAASTSWAALVTVPLLFPGVDSGGNLSDQLGTQGTVKANVNTKTGKFKATGKATVHNLSAVKQSYTNVPVNIPGVTVTSSKYVVGVRGAASVAASGIAR